MSTIPEYVIDMVSRETPKDCEIIPNSTPVISFGNFREVNIATLGINPSYNEFNDENGELLEGEAQRLATLTSLGAVSTEELTKEQATKLVQASDSYFQNMPYDKWFKVLDKALNRGFNVSYYNGTACHLDLSQWATAVKWSEVNFINRARLLDEGVPHLQRQLAEMNITHVVVNGKEVWEEIERSGLATFEDVKKITYGARETSCTLRIGFGQGSKFLGWTTNLQSGYGSNANEFINRLGDWLCENK